jgi:proline dehydrogenase
VKLTQLGLDESVDACTANLDAVIDAADRAGLGVMIDMEDHTYVDRTLEVFRAANARSPSTGLAIQSYLRRTPDDLFALPAGCRIRLVKGAYLEPSDIVVGGKREVDAAYTRLFVTALDRGHRIDVATHDERIQAGVRERLDGNANARERVEFQMLYGVRRDLQAQLAGQGYPVRVYIPYGSEWYPYLTRRLAERPANLWFFASNLVRT